MFRFTASWLGLLLLAVLELLAGPAQRVGVVLSGGARGLAHIGVLKALEANGILVDYLISSSMVSGQPGSGWCSKRQTNRV